MSEQRYLPDHLLLHRFISEENDEAFSLLVSRYGPMVMGVCRRILQHQQDTEDAFQATFLVLARKASSIKKSASLASWLYKVAFRIAIRAKRKRAKMQTRQCGEYPVLEEVSRGDQPAGHEFSSVVDEEIRKLPEKYRVPILLCYLQGYTNEEAARRLKCPTGTVKIRLLRAREMLRKRLVRQGVGWSALAWLVGRANEAEASPPQTLIEQTAELASQIQAGCELSNLDTTTQVLDMARSWLKKRARTKMKVAAAVLMTVLLVVFADRMSQRAKGATVQQLQPVSPTAPRPHDREQSPHFYHETPSDEQFVLRQDQTGKQLH